MLQRHVSYHWTTSHCERSYQRSALRFQQTIPRSRVVLLYGRRGLIVIATLALRLPRHGEKSWRRYCSRESVCARNASHPGGTILKARLSCRAESMMA